MWTEQWPPLLLRKMPTIYVHDIAQIPVTIIITDA